MKIKLSKGRPASDEVILALEAALGHRLSDSFRDFLRTQDGAKPELNIFKVSDNNESRVNRFIPANEILSERADIEMFPKKKHQYPVAWLECGNYAFIDEDRNGSVLFWDHESPEEIVELAPSFGAFLDLLEPFDIKTVTLKPGQVVKRVWIDPAFLERLKKNKS